MSFKWKEEYNLNIEEIDELLEYTKYHFEYEENMLKEYNYNHIHCSIYK